MIQIKSNSRCFVCGKTGSGKTTLIKNSLFNSFPRRIFHDIKKENSDLLISSPGTVLAKTPAELLDFMSRSGGIDNTSRSILYQPYAPDVEDFNKVCEIVYKYGNYTLVVDEAAYYAKTFEIQEYHKMIMAMGRSRGVGIVNGTQRSNSCNNILISEAEHLFIFRLNLKSDQDKLKTMLPVKYHEILKDIPEYHYIYSNANKTILCKPTRL